MHTQTNCPHHPQAENWPSSDGDRCAICGRLDDGRDPPREVPLIRTFDSYQRHVCARSGAATGLWKRDLAYFAIALPAEASELAETALLEATDARVVEELGDNLWGVATCADYLGVALSDLARRDARLDGSRVDATRLLHLNAYQEAVACEDVTRQELALSLVVHAGRFADAVKKHLYHGKELDRDELTIHCGYVLRRIANAARAWGVTLEAVANANVAKLRRRYPPDGYFAPRNVECWS